MEQTSTYYTDNWDMYWQSYLENNPDLVLAGINDRRKSKNHYLKRGISENRIVVKITELIKPTYKPEIVTVQPQKVNVELQKNDFLLHDNLFKD